MKIFKWLLANMATIFGVLQALIKLLKELLTGIVNLLLPVIPGDKFDDVIFKIRNAVNKVDSVIENIKSFFLSKTA